MTTFNLTRRAALALVTAACAAGLPAQTAPATPNKEVVELSPLTVTAESAGGYRVSTASTATRTNTALIDIPQTVDIVTKEFWDDIGATTFDQSFRYVANAYVRNRNSQTGDGLNLRGFETNGSIAVDGVRMGNNKRDLIGYERLEVVKGPPSAVQGRAGGTGLLNYIFKKPETGRDFTTFKYSYSADEYVGQMNRIEFDTNYSFQKNEHFAARVAGAWLKGDDYIKFNEHDSLALYPSFKWKLSPRTELVLVGELIKSDTPSREEGHGFAVYPEKLRRIVPQFDNDTDPITALHLPYDFNNVGPGSYDQEDIANATLFFTHQFNDWLFFRQVANIRTFGQDTASYTGEDNINVVMNSRYTRTINEREGSTAQGDLFAKYSFREWFTGMTMVGYSYDDSSSETENFAGVPTPPFDKLDLAAIAASGNSASYYDGRVSNSLLSSWNEADSYSVGLYIQQELGFFKNRLNLSGGLRSDHDVTETRNAQNDARLSGGDTTLNSYRYGATFKIRSNLALYIVKSVQNDATRTVQRYNGLLPGDPRLQEFFTVSPLTELKEIGLKGELFKGRMSFAINYWEMLRTGSTANILGNGISMGVPVTYGTVSEIEGAMSKGWEVSAYGSITDRLSLIANFTDMTTSQAFTGQQNAQGWNLTTNNPGTIPLRFAPEWNANVFLKYSFRDANQQGWEVKGGVTAIGPFYAQVTNLGLTRIPDSQKSIDLGVAYRWKNYNFDLMATNIANDPFLVTRDQPPRTYRFSVSASY